MKNFKKLYDCIKDVIATDEELDCSEAIGKWQETYKTLTEKKLVE